MAIKNWWPYLLVLLISGWAAGAEDPAPEDLRFGAVKILGLSFTHPFVIRRELLFTQGQPYDPRLLEESRRRIKALFYVKEAEVSTETVGRDVQVTLNVEEKLSWDLFPYSSVGEGNITLGTRIGDSNFLGRGLGWTAEYTYNTFRKHYGTLELKDPYFISESPIGGKILGGLGEVGYVIGANLWRSPRWAGEEWTFDLGGTYQRDTIHVFDQGLVIGQYGAQYLTVPFKVGHAWVDDKTRYGLSVGTRYERAKFTLNTGSITILPSDRERVVFLADAQVFNDALVKDAFYNQLGNMEEVAVGTRSSIGWEHATTGILSDLTYHTVRVHQGQDYKLANIGYMFLSVGVEGRVETKDLTNFTTVLQGKVAVRTLPVGFFIGRMMVDALLKNENKAQLFLGSDSGLRGYSVNRFSGEKRMLFNMEQRAVLFNSNFVDVGGVIFTDMGHVFKESELMDPRLLNTSVGMGVRIGSQKFGIPVARLDVGYGLTDRLFAVSFGTSQYF